jgi:hypothetical protein
MAVSVSHRAEAALSAIFFRCANVSAILCRRSNQTSCVALDANLNGASTKRIVCHRKASQLDVPSGQHQPISRRRVLEINPHGYVIAATVVLNHGIVSALS